MPFINIRYNRGSDWHFIIPVETPPSALDRQSGSEEHVSATESAENLDLGVSKGPHSHMTFTEGPFKRYPSKLPETERALHSAQAWPVNNGRSTPFSREPRAHIIFFPVIV